MTTPNTGLGRTNIITYTGNYFDYVDLESNVVNIKDVAHGLSNECRFAGQCPRFYSVAQHSVLVAELVYDVCGGTKDEALFGLIHDASESVMKDMPSPLKRIMPEYVALEARVQTDMNRRFCYGMKQPQIVTDMDQVALAIEKRDLMRNDDKWKSLEKVNWLAVDSRKLDRIQLPQEAELSFLFAYRKYST